MGRSQYGTERRLQWTNSIRLDGKLLSIIIAHCLLLDTLSMASIACPLCWLWFLKGTVDIFRRTDSDTKEWKIKRDGRKKEKDREIGKQTPILSPIIYSSGQIRGWINARIWLDALTISMVNPTETTFSPSISFIHNVIQPPLFWEGNRNEVILGLDEIEYLVLL